MLIFIDDSGDPGFKFGKGSTRYFVVLLLIFDDEAEAEKAAIAIKETKRSLGFRNDAEIKFHESSRVIRTSFLQALNPCEFKICALVIDKTAIKKNDLILQKESFYRYAIQTSLEYAAESILDAKIWIDGSGDEFFKKKFIAKLRQKLNKKGRKIIKHCKIVNSKGNSLIQMADMMAGAIRRSYDSSKNDRALYKSIIKNHIEHEWQFGEQDSQNRK